MREYPDGWGLAFEPQDMNASQQLLNGDDWPAGDCPALLARGSRSRVLRGEHGRSLAARRSRTGLVEPPAGHTVHETACGPLGPSGP